MKDLLDMTNDYRDDVAMRAIAHEDSAEWHRRRGAVLGGAATVLSAVVGSSIIAAVASHMKEGTITVPPGLWPSIFYFAVGLCLILAPVLSGLQTYLNDPQQAEKHRVTSAGYYHLQQEIDVLQLQYRDMNAPGPHREEALKKFVQIADQIQNLRIHSITLTDHAIEVAKAKLRQQSPPSTQLRPTVAAAA